MPLSNSVLRRYTPPTCTLQIIGRSSPLSRWAGQPVLKQLRFELHLDDPQLADDQKFDIQGDGNQLETLHAELTNYVQHLLNQSPDHLSTVLAAPTLTQLDTTDFADSPALNSAVDASQIEEASALDTDSIPPTVIGDVAARESNNTINNKRIYLEPGKGLTHNLFLGPLATEATGPVIPLGTLEMFDLVTALDESAADMVALPALGRSRFPAPPAWVSIAALVLVTAGLSTAVVQFLDRQHPQQQVATNLPQDPNSNAQIPPQPSAIPGAPPLATPETLPSGALPPLGALPPPSSSLQPRTLPRFTPGFPGTPGGIRNQTTPGFPSLPRPGAGQVFTTTPIRPELPQAPISIAPKTQQNRAAYSPFKPGISAPGGARSSSSFPDGRLPGTAPTTLPPLNPANPDVVTSSPGANTNTTASSNASTLPGGASSTPTNPKEPKNTAFDTVPQVAEAREFFKQRWNPPSNLTQTLEYNLILGVDGRIQRIEPLSQASNKYLDRTGMPLPEEPFVSPNKSGQAVTIRVVLSPDGKVQTFPQ